MLSSHHFLTLGSTQNRGSWACPWPLDYCRFSSIIFLSLDWISATPLALPGFSLVCWSHFSVLHERIPCSKSDLRTLQVHKPGSHLWPCFLSRPGISRELHNLSELPYRQLCASLCCSQLWHSHLHHKLNRKRGAWLSINLAAVVEMRHPNARYLKGVLVSAHMLPLSSCIFYKNLKAYVPVH